VTQRQSLRKILIFTKPQRQRLTTAPPSLEMAPTNGSSLRANHRRFVTMTGMTAAFVLQTIMLTTGAQPYAEAYRSTETTGRPLLVLVGADWCPACQTMKHGTLARMERSGKLGRVAYSIVNTDQESRVANQVMRGSSIPQLVLFTKIGKGWQRTQLTGAQSEGEVEALIGRAIQLQAQAQSAGDAEKSQANAVKEPVARLVSDR
jgi:thioredoxin-like negative regulator of GroEL